MATREKEGPRRVPIRNRGPLGEETPPSISELLHGWREAERALSAAEPDSEEWHRLSAECERARRLYRRAMDRVSVQESDRSP